MLPHSEPHCVPHSQTQCGTTMCYHMWATYDFGTCGNAVVDNVERTTVWQTMWLIPQCCMTQRYHIDEQHCDTHHIVHHSITTRPKIPCGPHVVARSGTNNIITTQSNNTVVSTIVCHTGLYHNRHTVTSTTQSTTLWYIPQSPHCDILHIVYHTVASTTQSTTLWYIPQSRHTVASTTQPTTVWYDTALPHRTPQRYHTSQNHVAHTVVYTTQSATLWYPPHSHYIVCHTVVCTTQSATLWYPPHSHYIVCHTVVSTTQSATLVLTTQSATLWYPPHSLPHWYSPHSHQSAVLWHPPLSLPHCGIHHIVYHSVVSTTQHATLISIIQSTTLV